MMRGVINQALREAGKGSSSARPAAEVPGSTTYIKNAWQARISAATAPKPGYGRCCGARA